MAFGTTKQEKVASWIGSTVFLILALVLSPSSAFAQGKLTITTETYGLPPLIIGVPYSQPLAASGGSPPYTWSSTGSVLPLGLVLTSSGLLTGTINGPLSQGNFYPVVTDSAGAKATK